MEEDIIIEDKEPQTENITCLSTKELKKLARPEFENNYEAFYPVKTLKKWGFQRNQCPKCKHFYWRYGTGKKTCGDSNCEGKYSFIGKGMGIGKKGQKINLGLAWDGFKNSLNKTSNATAIKRYPVVARWRSDVEYVAAGIYCFQPYCVTGEVNPPANPLTQAQFCLRFNDVDNIGITSRHYSGFVMLGIQVFNTPDHYVFFKEECVDYNLLWLTEELGISKEEITLIEDVWAGGGNMGPSIEYFVGGLEVGNMVFMQYRSLPDGRREDLSVQVIDVGIGLERIPWLINGSFSSYIEAFNHSFSFLQDKLKVPYDEEIWRLFTPYSCLLNIDEATDVDDIWKYIAQELSIPLNDLHNRLSPLRYLFIICDHTRSFMMSVYDGLLPSNTGASSNIRQLIRRVFSIFKIQKWWKPFGELEGLMTLFEKHQEDLSVLFGTFPSFPSFREIVENEYDRWLHTDEKVQQELKKITKKNKGLSLNDWIEFVSSKGISPDKITEITGIIPPSNLYYEITNRQEKVMKKPLVHLYDTAHYHPTLSKYDLEDRVYTFKSVIVDVLPCITQNNLPIILILQETYFYHTSGGQEHDTGYILYKGEKYIVLDVQKVGPTILHTLDRPLTLDSQNRQIEGFIDINRREQLRIHHSATHIVFASCRSVLGPHIWQNGAKKTPQGCHLDITHFKSISFNEQQLIEKKANELIQRNLFFSKSYMEKDEAEKQYGFSLYQGGVVPGNSLRIVSIFDKNDEKSVIDTEACCGTHVDNSAEIGCIKIIKVEKISDGIVRLQFVGGMLAINSFQREVQILHSLSEEYNVNYKDLLPTAKKFKKFKQKNSKLSREFGIIQCRLVLSMHHQFTLCYSEEDDMSTMIGVMSLYMKESVVFIGKTWIYALFIDLPSLEEEKNVFDFNQFDTIIKEEIKEEDRKKKYKVNNKLTTTVNKVKVVIEGISEVKITDHKTENINKKILPYANII